MATHKFDVAVVGTGPGGYVAAIRCAQLGLSVATVEDDRPGGVCLNWGCIPTKALLRNAEVVHLFEKAADFGITIDRFQADYAAAVKRSRGVADRMAKGVEFLFRKNKVTLLEALPRIVPLEDEEVSTQLTRSLSRRGITIKTGAKVSAVKPGGAGVVIDTDGGKLEAEQVLMAVGRGARTKGVGLEALNIALERGFVKVSPTMETSVKGVYAIGDMAGAPLLAHKAMAEGVVAAEAIAGKNPRPVDYGNVPSCTYCRPQIASIGLTEAKAKEGDRELAVGKFPFTANGKAVALGETEGFVKVVADKKTGELLGVHIIGPEATEIIHEFAVGRTLEATVDEIMHTIHAHPTLSEAALEATLGALGQAIHI